jgi:plasmid stability protein
MGDILLRNVDERTVAALQQRAALHGRSVEEEALEILHRTAPLSKAEALQIIDRIREKLPRQRTDSADLVREARDSR